MTRFPTRLAAACAVALALAGSAAAPANAYYLGYGNGDPGNWDFWTEQNGGRPMGPQTHAAPRATHHAHHYALRRHHAPARSDEVKHS